FAKLFPAGEDRLRIIPNGVAVPDDGAAQAARAARAARRAGSGWPHLVCVGRLIGIKGQDQLIDALPALRARFPDLSLTLAGDGAARPDLEARARRMDVGDAVRFAGVVSDIGAILARADLYVSTSHYEGLPMALLEAMAWGIPVVASDVPGNRDAVAPGETGRSYRLNDVGDLVRQVTLALEEPAAETMAASGRGRVVAENGAEAMTRRYRTLYEQVARRVEPGTRTAELR
ncbi:MAG TPA: glycosyltransferase, partial [Arenibaculum sp.]|nr:glycosyltransferase [Arenibaculum sp.]